VVEKWIYFIKNAGSLAYIPEILALLPELSQAFTIANEAGLTQEELEIQFKRKDFIILQRDSIALAASKAHEKGRDEGIEEGIGIGSDKTKLEIFRRLIAKGIPSDEAAEIAGLDVNHLPGQ